MLFAKQIPSLLRGLCLSSSLFIYLPWLLLCFLHQQTLATPIEFSNETLTDGLTKRRPPYPSRQQLYDAYKVDQPPKNKAFFWSGLSGGLDNAMYMGWAEDHRLIDCFEGSLYQNPGYGDVFGYDGSAAQMEQFQKDLLWAFAAHSKGKVYLLMPYGAAPPINGQFWQTEWPALRDSGQVTKIIWLDGNNPPRWPSLTTKVWWKRGMAQPSTTPTPSEVSSSAAPSSAAPSQTSAT